MLLQPYRVIDVSTPLGSLTGRILADLGASVTKIEPAGGDPARRDRPQLIRDDDTGDCLTWLALNANKEGLVLDLECAEGRRAFGELVEAADFVVESFPPGTLERWDLGYEELRERNPGLILVSITPFGQKGPRRDLRASDLEIWALGGAMSLAGEEGGEPMRVTAPQSAMWVGAEAAMGALTALVYRTRTGCGQHVDVSAQAAVVSALAHAPAFYDFNGVSPERAGTYITGRSVTGARMRVFWRCLDGWINFIIYGGVAGRHTNEQLVAWMDEEGFAPEWMKQLNWNSVSIPELTQEDVDRLERPIGDFFATLTKKEFLEGAIQRSMLGYPVSTVEDISNDRHLGAREFWQDLTDPASGKTLRYPGGFAVIDGQRLPIRRPAPAPESTATSKVWPTTQPSPPGSQEHEPTTRGWSGSGCLRPRRPPSPPQP